MINPDAFDWGRRIQEGMQQSQDNRRKNALLDLESRQVGMQENKLKYEMDAALKSRSGRAAFLREFGFPEELADDPDAPELIVELAKIKAQNALGGGVYGKVNPGDYDPVSLAAFDESVRAGNPDFARLNRMWAPINPKVDTIAGVPTQINPVSRSVGGYPAGGGSVPTMAPYQPIGPQAAPPRPSGGARPLSTLGNEADAKATLAASDAAGKKASERLDTLLDDAHRAQNELGAVGEAENLLNKGIIAGTAGNIRLEFGRLLATAGIGEGDEVSRTDAYLASTAGLVASVIKEFGAGTGLSDADREYAAKMAAGQIQLTPASMRRILGIRRRAALARVSRYNKQREKIISNPNLKAVGDLYDPIDVGGSSGGGATRIKYNEKGEKVQ